ncbi:MAG: TldD/PmbA family protein [Candidatus Latescibacteria bacterium]|nr:TldD/PmbA family protein [Candidatus Latescibacterota bacterium]
MIEKILESAKKKVDSAEVFSVETVLNEISFEAGKLKSAERKNITGIALRIIHDGHVGFSSTTDPNRTDEMIEAARESSRFGKKALFAFPGKSDAQPVDIFDPAVEAYSPQEAVEEGNRGIVILHETYPKGLAYLSIATSVSTISIANTSGLYTSYRSTDFSHDIVINIIDGDSILWIGDGGEFGSLVLKTDDYVKNIADLSRKAEAKAPNISGTFPVIFTAREIPTILQSIELGVDGMRLVKGDSPLIGREGEHMLGSVTLTDDPLIEGATGSRPFDDEGIPSQRTTIFKDGVFQSFLFDLDTAAEAGRTSTSNAGRSLLSSPSVSMSNLVMSTGESDLHEMISQIDRGVIVYGAIGGGQSNLITGDFAVNIALGFLIDKGEIAGRLSDTMVSGNVYDAFGAVSAMSRDIRQYGSFIVPDVTFSELSISGK